LKRLSILDRLFLLLTALLAAYQVVRGIEGLDSFTIASYTVAFGVLLRTAARSPIADGSWS